MSEVAFPVNPKAQIVASFNRDLGNNMWLVLSANAEGFHVLAEIFSNLARRADSGVEEEHALYLDQGSVLNTLSDAGIAIWYPPSGRLTNSFIRDLSLNVPVRLVLGALRDANSKGIQVEELFRLVSSGSGHETVEPMEFFNALQLLLMKGLARIDRQVVTPGGLKGGTVLITDLGHVIGESLLGQSLTDNPNS